MTTEDIFQFLAVRPPQLTSDSTASLQFARFHPAKLSPFNKAIADYTLAPADPTKPARDYAENLAGGLIKDSARYVASVLPDVQRAAKLACAAKNVSDARVAVQTNVRDVPGLLNAESVDSPYTRCWESYYAQMLKPDERPMDRVSIETNLRYFALFKWLDTALPDAAVPSLADVAANRLLIPASLFPKPDNSARQKARETMHEASFAFTSEAVTRAGVLELAIAQIPVAARAYNEAQQGRVLKEMPTPKPGIQNLEYTDVTGAFARTTVGEVATGKPVATSVFIQPLPSAWLFADFGKTHLDKEVFDFLSSRKSEFANLFPEEIGAILESELYYLVRQLLQETPASSKKALRDATSSLTADEQKSRNKIYGRFLEAVDRMAVPFYPAWTIDDHPPTPTDRGIRPLGIGDLHVVRQFPTAYKLGEVAHVENVLQSEKRQRMTDTVREVEDIVTVETEKTEETEKDLQTTERFELNREAAQTVKESESFDAGVSLSASYGPVTINSHADFATASSKDESQRTSSAYAKDVMERSVSRVLKRTREERTRRTLERFEERNEHAFDNTAGSGNIAGVYRWIDKYYCAQVVNYGRRLMMEFTIPEPAAFYAFSMTQRPVSGVTVPKPKEPIIYGRKLKPSDLNAINYGDFVSEFNVPDAKAYPDRTMRINGATAATVQAGGNENKDFATSSNIQIPDGYECLSWFGTSSYQGYDGKFINVLVSGADFSSSHATTIRGNLVHCFIDFQSAYLVS